MTETQAGEAILQLWAAGWEALHPADTSQASSVPWCTDDELDFKVDQLGQLGSWARIVFRPATDEQLSQGPIAMNEVAGSIIVSLFGPLNQGTKPLTLLADDVRTVLKRKRSGTLRTHDAASSKPTQTPDGQWAMRVVTVEVRYTYMQ